MPTTRVSFVRSLSGRMLLLGVLPTAMILVGIIVNAVISAVITRRKLYLTDNTHLCVLNLSVAFLIQLIVVVPLTLFVIVVHNWVLGSFICYSLPILQVSTA